MDFKDAENLSGGVEYVETVRALHQTVVSLRSALEQSRSEVLQLKTRAWPLEDLESALTALSLENHLLRKKILDLNGGESAGDGLARRFRSITSSLENLTAKSQGKSSQFSSGGLPSRTKSFQSFCGVADHEPVFTSTPLRSNHFNIIKDSKLRQDHNRIQQQNKENRPEEKFSKGAKTKTVTYNREDIEEFEFIEPIKQKLRVDERVSEDVNDFKNIEINEGFQTGTEIEEQETEVSQKNQILEKKFDLENVKIEEHSNKSPEQKTCVRFHELQEEISFTRFEDSLPEIKSRFEDSQNKLSSVSLKNKLKTNKSIESLDLFEETNELVDIETNIKEKVINDDSIESLENFLKNKDENLLSLESTKTNQSNSVNKQVNSRPLDRDKQRDKKISVCVNLEIYRKTGKNKQPKSVTPEIPKMEPEEKKEEVNVNENILRHTSSTDLLDQEVDDIELIFTNEDTKESNLKEPLISIEGGKQSVDFDRNNSAEGELEDDVFNDNFENENQENINFQSQTFDFTRENSQIYNSKSDNSINHEEPRSLKSYYSYQDSSFENKSLEKDESFDRFEERVRIVETDISKVGIQDVEYSMGRRNTCPNPIQYRPIAHREAISRGFNTRKTRPILAHSSASRKESGAQTDISALPNKSSWRSESSLAHKIGDNFTTLPSKYPLPGSRLRLSEKTVEARRILLSDIGFTSMVPELSRSADHLFPPNLKTPSVTNYGQFLKTTDLYSPAYTSQRFMWTNASPSDSHSQSRYSSLYPLPSPPAPSRRCSAPVSPCRKNVIKHAPSKVRFANGSLPELRGDWNTTIDSGDSTDSLVEEAEQYLRRSIDCIVGGKDVAHPGMSKTSLRRASAPEPARDNIPPQGWQPFLPRLPRDLRLDYWVKVISPEGRVRGGRVRFIGDLASHTEPYVGVQLSMPDGHSDGTYNNRRYFQCEPYHGIFVPFKKVIMGWKP